MTRTITAAKNAGKPFKNWDQTFCREADIASPQFWKFPLESMCFIDYCSCPFYNIYDETKFGQITECIHNNLELTQIGTFSRRKNQLFSLEVVNRIKKDIPNVHLNIVGKEMDEGYLEKMNLCIKNNNLQTNVSILGTSTDRIELNRHTSYVLYPSTMESFGLILIESQSSGIHCFANKDIPNDADMGNADFLELNPGLWSKSIIDYYKKHKNERKNPSNMDRFSKENFINTIKKLYS